MLQEIYLDLIQKPYLRYVFYPFWTAGRNQGVSIAQLLSLIIAIYGAWACYALVSRGYWHQSLEQWQKYAIKALAVMVGIVIWLFVEPVAIANGGHIRHPAQLVVMAALFWPAVITTIIVLAVRFAPRHITVRKTRQYTDYFLRGSRLVEPNEFNRHIKKEYRFDSASVQPITFGGVVIPPAAENYHFTILGATGSGKSQVMYPFIEQINRRSQSMILFDVGGHFHKRFCRSDDIRFNPLSDGSWAWNPLKDLESEQDCFSLATAICGINESDASGRKWVEFARTFIASILLKLRGSDDLAHFLFCAAEAPMAALEDFLTGTPAAGFVQPKNDETFQSIRTTVVGYIQAWRYLVARIEQHPDKGVSLKKWIREQAAGHGSQALYIVIKDSEMATLKHVIATFYAVAIQESLDIPRFDYRMWFFMDELDSMGAVSGLKDGLTRLRKHNVTIVMALQTITQLVATYGREIADVLLVNARVKIVMNCQGETARQMSEWLGKQEVKRVVRHKSQSTSSIFGKGGDTTSSSNNIQLITVPTVLPSELSALPNLTGYAMISGGLIVKFKARYLD